MSTQASAIRVLTCAHQEQAARQAMKARLVYLDDDRITHQLNAAFFATEARVRLAMLLDFGEGHE